MYVRRMPAAGAAVRPRLLVTGAGGFLGWNVCRELAARWDVTAVISRSPAWPGVAAVQADLTAPGVLPALLQSCRPRAVLHLAALSAPNVCEQEPLVSHRINVDASAELADLCRKRGIALAFTSSSQVFDGRARSYTENDPVCPLNVYGRHKAEAEQAVLTAHPDAVVCRLPLMFGPSGPHTISFLQQVLRAERDGRTMRLFTDEFRCFLSARDAAAGLELALTTRHSGLLHLAGPQCLSRLDFGRAVERVLGRHVPIIAARQSDVAMAATRPERLDLCIDLARSLGFTPGTIDEELAWALGHPFSAV